MAATGKTPILLYGSTTPTNAPTAGNLTNSSDGCEIAINVADKNLFFKDSTNTVNTVPIRQSGTSSNGWLSSTDWNTFNNKQPAGTYVTSVTGTAPVVSSGGTTPAISMAAANGSTNGYLTSTDWTTFNSKAPAFTYTSGYIPYGQGTTTPTQSANWTYNGTDVTLTGGNYLCSAGKGVAYLGDATRIVTPEDNVSGGLFQVGSGAIIRFKSGTSTEIVRMFGTGGVSIGNTTDPGATNLSVTGSVTSAQISATCPQTTSTTSNYSVIKTNGYSYGGGTQSPAGVVEGAWNITTSNSDIAPVTIGASEKWRVILIGGWGNYYEGFNVTGPGNYCEVTSDSNTITVGSRVVTISRNGTSGYLQWICDSYGAEFQGTIIISNSGGAPTYSCNVKGGISALGVYSSVVGATNRDVYVDNTGALGYVSSTLESKTNIKEINDTDWLLKLTPVEFNRRKKEFIYDSENDKLPIGEKYSEQFYEELEYGLIADYAENINSNICFYDNDQNGSKKLMGIHYSKLITPILKLVQQQNSTIKILEDKISKLEGK